MASVMTAPEFMTVAEVAERLRISTPRTYALIEEAGIPYTRITERRIRVERAAFDAWLRARTFRSDPIAHGDHTAPELNVA